MGEVVDFFDYVPIERQRAHPGEEAQIINLPLPSPERFLNVVRQHRYHKSHAERLKRAFADIEAATKKLGGTPDVA